eukprot:COSAG03_NODE_3221_length_2136_cov_4.566028_1_plen_67_part_10
MRVATAGHEIAAQQRRAPAGRLAARAPGRGRPAPRRDARRRARTWDEAIERRRHLSAGGVEFVPFSI